MAVNEGLEQLLNVRQVAFILKVHHLTVRRYIKEGRLKAVKVGGNVRIKESQLLDFNKDYSSRKPNPFRTVQRIPAKIFVEEDPIFRLVGRGASLIWQS